MDNNRRGTVILVFLAHIRPDRLYAAAVSARRQEQEKQDGEGAGHSTYIGIICSEGSRQLEQVF